MNQKNFITALLLSIFLGALGIDRFYLGKIGTGLLKLFISIFSFGALAWIWWLVDIILIASGTMTDKWGRTLSK
jgi:TM2 domain-containing membrane protein YozV